MPIHDWTRVDAGLFHHFHEQWIVAFSNGLNAGVLPPGYVALVDQVTGGPIPDIVTLQRPHRPGPPRSSSGVAIAECPPQAQFVIEGEEDIYARRANRVRIQHRHGDVVAVIEIVSPGNKNSRHGLASFVRKSYELLQDGINLLIVDLFPPSERDPQGIHKAIWDEIAARPFQLPEGKPLTVAAYHAATVTRAYVEPVAVGDELPSAPLFLDEDMYVPAPLEATYRVAWDVFPIDFRDLLEPESPA